MDVDARTYGHCPTQPTMGDTEKTYVMKGKVRVYRLWGEEDKPSETEYESMDSAPNWGYWRRRVPGKGWEEVRYSEVSE